MAHPATGRRIRSRFRDSCDHCVTSRALFALSPAIPRRDDVSRDYTGHMDIRRATFGATVRLAIVFSTIAAVVALGLDAIGDVSPTALVLGVIVIGFAISWWRTGAVTRTEREHHRPHRIAVVPVRSRVV